MSGQWDTLLVHEKHQLQIDTATIMVEDGVFTPNPDLTHSTAIVIKNLPDVRNLRVADVGTGTGILAILAAQRGAREVVATDVSDVAIKNALSNIELNGVVDKINVLKTSLLENVEGTFDLICANLPILEKVWNTSVSNLYRTFLSHAKNKLDDQGRIYIPWSSFAEKERAELENAIKESGFEYSLTTVNKLDHEWYLYILTRTRSVVGVV